MRFPSSTPLFPTRGHFVDYLRRYAGRFDVPVQTNADVRSIGREDDTLDRRARRRTFHALSNGRRRHGNRFKPVRSGDPEPGALQRTCASQRRLPAPGPFANQRVLVVGAGNSSGEISRGARRRRCAGDRRHSIRRAGRAPGTARYSRSSTSAPCSTRCRRRCFVGRCGSRAPSLAGFAASRRCRPQLTTPVRRCPSSGSI